MIIQSYYFFEVFKIAIDKLDAKLTFLVINILLKSSRLISFSSPTVCLNSCSSHIRFSLSNPDFTLNAYNKIINNNYYMLLNFFLPYSMEVFEKINDQISLCLHTAGLYNPVYNNIILGKKNLEN